MKKLLFAFLFLSLGAKAQKSFCLIPACTQTITTADTVNVYAQMLASDGIGSFSYKQVAGPAVALPAAVTVQTYNGFVLRNLAAGTYVFSISGTSATGSSGTVQDTVVVNAAVRRIAYVLTVFSDSTRIKNQ